MLTGYQLEEHNRCITGSKVASILGLSSKKSKWQLFCEMRGDIEREELKGDHLLMGSCAELAFDKFLQEKYGWQVEIPPEGGQHHEEHKFLFGLVDRFVAVDGVKYILEYKNFDKFYKGNWDTDVMDNLILPDTVLTQIHFYMLLWGMPAKAFVCFGGNEPYLIDVPRNPDIEGYILKECIQFWDDLQKGNYPEPDYGNEGTSKLLSKIYNCPIGDYLDGTTEEMEIGSELAQLKIEIAPLEERKTYCSNWLKARINDHEGITFPDGWGYTYKRNKSSRIFNEKKFIIENPELAQRYMEDVAGARVLREKDFNKKK